eukprot:11124788-Ditylum_brightwellii.AAC.1
MLMYLASNSRPEVAFAVHQCARITHGTKHSHEKAILQICKYLKRTKNDGLNVCPSKDLQANCYADAGCPIQWVSKLQTEIELSTPHGEYMALSQSLRELLSVKALITELMAGIGKDTKKLDFISKSIVYEDNNGAIR